MFDFQISKLLLTCTWRCFEKYAHKAGQPFSGFHFHTAPYLPARVLTNSSISLYLSVTHGLNQPGEHDGLLLKKWSNGWIRKRQKDKGCSERKERRNESPRTPVACYLITVVPACHARLTGPLRSALAPCKAPSIQQPLLYFSQGTKKGDSLWFLSCPDQNVCRGSGMVHIWTHNRGMGRNTEALSIAS